MWMTRKIEDIVYTLTKQRYHDERASYAILDTTSPEHQIDFFRLPYDIDSVAEKIYAISELDDWLGDRLTEGR